MSEAVRTTALFSSKKEAIYEIEDLKMSNNALFLMFPVFTKITFLGLENRRNESRKSESLLMVTRSLFRAKSISSESLLKLPFGRSEEWKHSKHFSMRIVLRVGHQQETSRG
jgi:hypothetical protein